MKKIIIFLALAVFFSATASAIATISYSLDTSSQNNSSVYLDGIVRSNSALLQVNTDQPVTCRYSTSQGLSYSSMQGTFDFNFETLHKKTLTDLTDGIYKYYIKCRAGNGEESGELEAVFTVSVPVSAKISLEEDSPLSSGTYELKLTTSKLVSQTPSLSYSYDGISYDPIPLFGSEDTWTGYLIVSNSKDSVGSFKFQGKDLEGFEGTEITEGGIFLVDTKAPETITDIKAESIGGGIRLSWFIDEEIEESKIYKSTSPNVDYSDFYREIDDDDSYLDTSVEKGKTYYYRVSGIDEAGNEADLSIEVSATALLSSSVTSSSGLELRLHGLVDNLISEINLVVENLRDAKNSLESKSGIEGTLYEDLKLEREIDSANSELDSLKKEIGNFKSQSLSENELDKKLNSARLKLNTVKKKIPENIRIIEEESQEKQIDENLIASILLELTPEISESLVDKKTKKSLEIVSDKGFGVETSIYNIEILYIDGSRKEVSLIKEEIDSSLESNTNLSIIESIPKNIEESILNIDVKNNNYDVLKEDLIISLPSETKEIIYSVEKHVDLNTIAEIKTILLYNVEESETSNAITGYFSFVEFREGGSYFGIVVGIIVLLALGAYLFNMKRTGALSEKLIPIKRRIFDAEEKIHSGDSNTALKIYHYVSEEYNKLDKKSKKLIYPKIENLHKKIISGNK